MLARELVVQSPAGLYCPAGDFHVDPVRGVPRALITHGHADHARRGHGRVLATRQTLDIMAVRYGEDFCQSPQTADLGAAIRIGDVEVTFAPAGHVLGSAQILIDRGGARLVVSGDYKRAADPTCLPFEPIACQVFITEATFGLPIFRHPDAAVEVRRLVDSIRLFPERTHLVGAYALGKAQRVMALVRAAGWERPLYLHGAMVKLTDYYAREGIDLGETRRVDPKARKALAGEIVICPPGQLQDLWARKMPDVLTCFASGWMRTRARARQKGVELPLVISDHADWTGLQATILETGCEEVWVTHGQEDALVHWARSIGLQAQPLHLLGYGDEGDPDEEPAPPGGEPPPA